MNRRQMLMIPGAAAAAAGAVLAETPLHPPTVIAGVSRKSVSKYSRSSEIYKVPKTATKSAKYVTFLTTLLGLTTEQQQQISSIYASAMQTQTTLRTNMKTARQTLVTAVKNGDSSAVGQVTSGLGLMQAQHLAAGASANIQVLQVLTPSQQTQLEQFQA